MKLMNLFKPTGDTIKGTLEGVGELAKDIRESITGENPELAAKVLELEAQIRVAEAQNKNWFVSGWRPHMGWWCGIAIGLNFVIRPLLNWITAVKGLDVEMPPLDIVGLISVVGPFLFLGGARTIEKSKGVQANH